MMEQASVLDVYFNASSLLGPKTGVGQYCLQLLTEMRGSSDIRSHYFYHGLWSDELLAPPPRGDSGIRRTKLAIAEKVPQIARVVHRFRQLQNNTRFVRGLSASGVYHEPNFLSFNTKLPTVLTVHDLSVMRYPEMHPRYRVAVFGKRLRDSIDRADCIVTDSEYVRQEVIAEFGLPTDKVTSVLLAASSEFSPMAPESAAPALAELGLRDGQYILAVGTLEPRKNLTTAIEAYTRLPEAIRSEMPFVIVGMKGWKTGSLDRTAAQLIEKGQIRLAGYVPDEVLPALYSGSRCFVYPSLYEGFGLPPLEAMACGAAVIVSDRSSLPEVVGDGGIQIDAPDVDGLAEAMLSIIESDYLRRELGQRGIRQAARFSWRQCAEQTAEIYRRVAR